MALPYRYVEGVPVPSFGTVFGLVFALGGNAVDRLNAGHFLPATNMPSNCHMSKTGVVMICMAF